MSTPFFEGVDVRNGRKHLAPPEKLRRLTVRMNGCGCNNGNSHGSDEYLHGRMQWPCFRTPRGEEQKRDD